MKQKLINSLIEESIRWGINFDTRKHQVIEAFEMAIKENKKISEWDAIKEACGFVAGVIGFYDINERLTRLENMKGGENMAKKNNKSSIKDIYNGEGITVWEDGELVTIAIGLATIAVEKEHWEAIKEDFKKLLDL